MRPNKGNGKGKKMTNRVQCVCGVFKPKKISLLCPQRDQSLKVQAANEGRGSCGSLRGFHLNQQEGTGTSRMLSNVLPSLGFLYQGQASIPA